MGHPGVQMWGWTLCFLASWMYVSRVLAGPQYIITVPAVVEAGAEAKFCGSILQPNESLDMTVALVSEEQNIILLRAISNEDFHGCFGFEVPLVQGEKVYNIEVEVKGETFYSKEVRKVMAKAYKPMTFIQTDKPLYLPGQTVHFRVVTLDARMRPTNRLYNLIEIEDANDNRVAQWLNQTADRSILQLSYALNSEAHEGFYQVIVAVGEEKIYHSFKVEKYVLPKYDVKITAADEVNIEQEEVEVEICAKYTYGQPVPGSVKLQVCRPLNRYYGPVFSDDPEAPGEIKPPCHEDTKETTKKGCATFTIKMSSFKKLDQKILQDALDVFAEVEEEGTGIKRSQTHRLQISYVIGKLTFLDTPKSYAEGSDVEGKVKAVDYRDVPIADMDLYLFEGDSWSAHLLRNLTTNAEGVATFSFSTSELQGDIKLHLSAKPTLEYYGHRVPHYDIGRHVLSLILPPSVDTKPISSLEVVKKDSPLSCDTLAQISIRYTVVGEEQGSMTLMYLVLSRGAIVMQGFKQIPVEQHSLNEGEISFDLKVDAEIAPEVQVLAFAILPSENVIANSADFSTEKCFSHKVSLEFIPSSSVPGEKTTMKVVANPDSLCGVSAVDQSVLIKKPGKTLTADKIFDLLPVTKASHIPYEVVDSQECLQVRPKRYILPYPSNRDDAYTVFQNVGMKVATNLFVRMPSCLTFRGRDYHHGNHYVHYDGGPMIARMETRLVGMAGVPGSGAGSGGGGAPAPIETVRTFFPETWIWDLVEVGPSGTTDVSLTVPDTITTWETEAFCLSPQGFGLAPRKEITVFQPFFLELTMPYSIIRGEHFELKATVFNYLSSCIMVFVNPDPSLDFSLTPLSGAEYTSCVCGNERKTLSWKMVPSALGVVNVTVKAEAQESHLHCGNEIVSVPERGRIDVVTRPLVVKAEGVEVTQTHNLLLCPKGEALTEAVELQLPENVIVGSARASLSVLGDILGRALKNLDGLLRMPYGCGEQNMALLAPNIYILQYLKSTQQLTPAILEKATNFLASGYQRQLNYRHHDGAFSTFGSGPGNTWLTAFVARSFAKAKSFIYIDPAVIRTAKAWPVGTQRENGCFRPSGKLFNNRMKGGVSDDVTLTAYITASFLEMNQSAEKPEVTNSLRCLRESVGNFSNTYTTALLAYVFTLAGDTETRALLLKHLDTVAIKGGGFLHWSQKSSETSASLSVEISSYVILAKLSAGPSAEDLGYASRIVRWLTGQQNHYGGFSSTQDTVVALQALALYSTLVFSPEGSSTVKVQSPSGLLTFDVNPDNKLLYQEKMLPDMTGKYSVEVKGSTCASMQLNLHYNIPTPSEASTLRIQVKAEGDCTKNRHTLSLQSQYSGDDETTNMVILDIKMLSGFSPDPESLKELRVSLLVDRVEDKEDHVLVYIRELPNNITINHKLELIQEMQVHNLRPAVIQIYDYYQPSDKAETEYMSPCPSA